MPHLAEIVSPCRLLGYLAMEHDISITYLGPATPNFAKLPQTHPLYHRTIAAMSQVYQQIYPAKSQTNHCNVSFLN